ncbi:MAG: hypothetical protein V4591_04650 [Bdellovibrionota bacterium]
MEKIHINQEENEDAMYNPGHYYGASTSPQERHDAVVIDDDSADWRDIVKQHTASKNPKPLKPKKSFFRLGLL